jgi:hypothetical protein
VRGRKHDYDLFKDKHPSLPEQVEINTDPGYQGMEKNFPSLRVRILRIPVKKKRGKPPDRKDKRHNRKLNRKRVIVEHAIGRLKKFGIMGGVFRNKLGRYDDMASIVSGLVNFQLMIPSGFDLNRFTA